MAAMWDLIVEGLFLSLGAAVCILICHMIVAVGWKIGASTLGRRIQ